MDRGGWWATAHGAAKSQTHLSTHAHYKLKPALTKCHILMALHKQMGIPEYEKQCIEYFVVLHHTETWQDLLQPGHPSAQWRRARKAPLRVPPAEMTCTQRTTASLLACS